VNEFLILKLTNITTLKTVTIAYTIFTILFITVIHLQQKLLNNKIKGYEKVINIKNNKEYILFDDIVINASDDNENQEMYLYSDNGKFYVEEKNEFNNKFKIKE